MISARVSLIACISVLLLAACRPGAPLTIRVETAELAVAIVHSLPEVQAYERTLAAAGAEAHVDAELGGGQWLVHVYEIKDGHTATFNWYTVDRATGEVKAEFP